MNESEKDAYLIKTFFVLTWCHGSLEIFTPTHSHTHKHINKQQTNKNCIVGSRVSFSDSRESHNKKVFTNFTLKEKLTSQQQQHRI